MELMASLRSTTMASSRYHVPNPNAKRERRLAETETAEHLQPVAFVQSAVQFAERALSFYNVLLAPQVRNAAAGAGIARVHVNNGAAAFVINDGHTVCVLGLHDPSTRLLESIAEVASRAHRQLFNQLLKSAAAIQTATMGRGIYSMQR